MMGERDARPATPPARRRIGVPRPDQHRTQARRGLARAFALALATISLVMVASCAPVTHYPAMYDLQAQRGFDERNLLPETRTWYDRFLFALASPRQYPDIARRARQGDLYNLARYINTEVTTTLTVFRLTGDLRLLDEVDGTLQLARAKLADSNGDGFPNWRWLHDPQDPTYYGTDRVTMDEIMTHAMIAEAAWAFKTNRAERSPAGVDYGARADFWTRYLGQWETKWRRRNHVPSGFPFLEKNLIHPFVNLIRYHWYMYRLTNRQDYLDESLRLADLLNRYELRPIATSAGPGLVFALGITHEEPDLDVLDPVHYARYTTQALMDLVLDGFPSFTTETTLVPIANTIATKVIDNGSKDFAITIGGDRPVGGLGMPAGEKRTSVDNWDIYPMAEYAAFDDSGTIAAVSREVYAAEESGRLERPSRVAIPAAMVIDLLLSEPGGS